VLSQHKLIGRADYSEAGARERWLMRHAFLALVVLFAASCGTSTRGVSVRRIEVAPSPEGPTLVASADTASGKNLLSKVRHMIPTVFPGNPHQECHLGTTINIVVGSKTYMYGPCRWPQVIERLRQALINAASTHQLRASGPPRLVSTNEWKAVFQDWYDSRMDHWHSCAAVQEAIRHLPADGLAYSTISLDLEAYARGVCSDEAVAH
jgi:hypothetical protein